jgi:hypothetical protein
MPALITQDLSLLAGNDLFARKCGLAPEEIPGMGIEQIVHPDSLRRVIAIIRKGKIGDKNVPIQYAIYIKTLDNPRFLVDISVYPLKDPKDSALIIGNGLELAHSITRDRRDE